VNAVLVMEQVVKRYGRTRALDGLDLEVPAGSVFGLVGSNGAGKTTAMAVTVGLLHAAGGTINLLGEGPFHASRHAGRVTLLPQDSRFPPHARVRQLLCFYARLQGLGAAEIERNVDELLDWVHLQDRRHAAIRTLSHGMNRRVAIAQAFLGQPELVLLDEPLSGLDPREAARVREMIRLRRGRQTIVISSHILGDIEAVCDSVAFIERGRRIRQDTLDTIVRRSHRVTYTVARGPVPLEALRQALPDVVWEASPDGLEVTAAFTAPHSAEELNALTVDLLVRAGAGVMEIRRGSDLESEYLNASAAHVG
jgi:ABC-2 type transport system ATP-binding protein